MAFKIPPVEPPLRGGVTLILQKIERRHSRLTSSPMSQPLINNRRMNLKTQELQAMKFGNMIFQGGFTYPQIKEIWLESEKLGFDSVWAYDHLDDCLEGWTLISALAPMTDNIRFGLMVTCNSYRHPPLLAKMGATLDIISDGRLEFGIGAGDKPTEYIGYGYPFPKASVRIKQLDEALTVIKKIWTEESPTFEGKYYSIKEAKNEPKPIQKPHPPIWIGSLSGKKLIATLAANHSDVYNIRAWNTDDYVRKMDRFKECCRLVGRKYEDVEKTIHITFAIGKNESHVNQKLAEYSHRRGISLDECKKQCHYGTPDELADMIEQYAKLGVQGVILCFQPDKKMEDLHLFAEVIQGFG